MQCEQVRCFLESWIQARVITVEFLQIQPLAVTGLAAELDLAAMAPSSLCTNAVLGSDQKFGRWIATVGSTTPEHTSRTSLANQKQPPLPRQSKR